PLAAWAFTPVPDDQLASPVIWDPARSPLATRPAPTAAAAPIHRRHRDLPVTAAFCSSIGEPLSRGAPCAASGGPLWVRSGRVRWNRPVRTVGASVSMNGPVAGVTLGRSSP